MASQVRNKTNHAGVVYYELKKIFNSKPDRSYILIYRKKGKQVEEKAGRASEGMTPAKASRIRADRVRGIEVSNQEKRALEKAKSEKWTFEAIWKIYLDHKGEYSSLQSDQSIIGNHLAILIKKEPSELVPLDLERLKKQIKKKGRSDQTIKHCLNLLKRLANYGFDNQLCPNLQFRLKLPTVKNHVKEALSPQEISSLLHALSTRDQKEIPPWIFRIALYTGRRPKELFNLQWSDVNLHQKKVLLRNTKSGTDEDIPLSDIAVEIFKQIPKYSETWVFPNYNGTKRNSCKKAAKSIQRQAGIPEYYRPLYCLRHTFSSVADRCDLKERHLQKLIGHSSFTKDITKRYMEISSENLYRATNIISNYLLNCKKIDKKITSVQVNFE